MASPTDDSGVSSSTKVTWQHWLGVFSAPVALGLAVGFFTGQSGSDATVVAAVLPTVLAGAGSGLFGLIIGKGATSSKEFPSAVQIGSCVGITLFSFTLVVGSFGGTNLLRYTQVKSAQEADFARIALNERERALAEFHRQEDLRKDYEYLQKCSQNEFLLNDQRRKIGLPVLPLSAFCPALDLK